MMSNNLFDKNQFGFQKNLSTITAITELTDDIAVNIEKKLPTLCVYIDFQKAFDKLNHNVLLEKLKHFAFTSETIEFFENYLNNHKQTTFVNNLASKKLTITHGVPQGSVYGPLLFYYMLMISDN